MKCCTRTSRLLLCAFVTAAGLSHPDVAPAQANQQDAPFVLDVRGRPLSEALALAAQAMHIDLAYAPELVVDKTSPCRIRSKYPGEILGCVLDGTGLEAQRLSAGAWLIRAEVRETPVSSDVPQHGVISGTVRSAGLGAVTGAHVVVLNTFLGDATDGNGSYLIDRVPPGNYVVVASCIGFRYEEPARVEVRPGDTLVVEIEMAESPHLLGELTVVAGYDRFTSRFARSIPLALQHVGLSGVSFGLLVAANPGATTNFQLSTLGNLAGSDLKGIQMSAGVNYTGGVAGGVQIGAIGNRAGSGLRGVQIGGLFSASQDHMTGIQITGLSNVTWSDAGGIQIAGAGNVTARRLHGAQVAGGFNGAGRTDGWQAAGAVNFARSLNGAQIAGAVNVAPEMSGAQIAGALNIARDRTRGVQLAGAVNVAKGRIAGLQIAGAVNTAGNPAHGLQLAGAVNIAKGEMSGLQIAGAVNVARISRGLQIGLVNIAEENTGIPVGLFSYVRNFGLRYDLWADDTGMVTTAIRSGNRSVSSFLGLGVRPGADAHRWAPVVGLGTEFHGNGPLSVLTDVLHYYLGFKDDHLTSLVRLRLLLSYEPTGELSIFAGPSYSGFFSKSEDGSHLAPWSQFEGDWGGTNYRFWPGLVAGIRIKG